MNIALRIDRPGIAPYAGAEFGPVLLGMPHLAVNGLSETWLLKELGHRHWLQLARMSGRDVPSFQDRKGNAVYAAFRSVEIAGANFSSVRENDTLHIDTELSRMSLSQVQSRHTLAANGVPIGVVTMISVFVRRDGSSSNHSVVRVEIDGLPPHAVGNKAQVPSPSIAPNRMLPFSGLGPAGKRLNFMPCPSQDFNGAGFLYFSSFVAFVDRAEYAVDPKWSQFGMPNWREIAYYSNLDPGDQISIDIIDIEKSDSLWKHYSRITRASDAKCIAEVVTVKIALNHLTT
jgi:probable biosynthetic protein (TIGR04099 family)